MTNEKILKYSSTLRVLYVEDDKRVQKQTLAIFDAFFNTVAVADNGELGLASFIQHKETFESYPDIVITDIQMPRLDGVAMIAEILKLNPNQKIIVLSSHIDNDHFLDLVNMGINNFLIKPIHADGLYRTLLNVTKGINCEKMEVNFTREIEEIKDLSTKSAKAKDAFLANMSHEIRTPMNAILGLSHLLLKTDLDKKQHDYLKKIKDSGDMLLNIVNDILDFSKIEAGKLDIEYITFDINTMLDNVTNVVYEKAQEKGLELVFDIDNSVPAQIKGDPLRIGQVIINLLNNAIKFTNKGEVVLKIRELSGGDDQLVLEFQVIDTGIGLTHEQLEQLFQTFSQADVSISRVYGGTGLGLTISKQLVELMNGAIEASSTYGEGSNFTFTIKTQRVERRSYRLPSKVLLAKKSLIVGTNTKTSAALSQMLEYFQYETLQASNAQEARALIQENGFDIIFIDKKMIGLLEDNGLQKDRHSKVVAIGSGLSEDVNITIKGIDIDATLPKPFNQQMIFDTIIELFDQEQALEIKEIAKQDLESRVDIPNLEAIRGSQILLAEDNTINQTVMLGLLESTGVEVIVANDGKDAIDKLRENPEISLILMDINMPVMDGYEATKQIRKDSAYENLPIVALTASAMRKDIDKAKKVGMQEHLGKPIDVEALYTVLLQYLGSDNNIAPSKETKKPQQSAEEAPVYSIDEKAIEEKATVDYTQRLYKLEGLNVDEGIERVGGKIVLYKNVLIDFAELNKNSAIEIESLINKGRSFDALQQAHSIKGTAANLGAYELSELAAEIESALEENNKPKSLDLLGHYDKALEHFIKSIDALKSAQWEIQKELLTQKKPTIEIDHMRNILGKLLKEAKKRKALPCGELSDELEVYQWPPEYEDRLSSLIQSVKRYKFKEIVKIIEEIL